MYRGFKRKPSIIQQVRQEFLDNKIKFIEIIDGFEPDFDNSKQFSEARNYILDFFKIIENDVQFQKEISNRLRTK